MTDVRQELRAVLTAVEMAVGRGASATEIATLLYDESAIIVAEGAPSATCGVAAAIPEMQSVLDEWGPHPRMAMRIADPILAAESTATTFLDVECQPNIPGAQTVRYRLLSGWRKGRSGWRIVLEMYTSGAL